MTHSSSLFPSWRRFFRYWARRKTLVRALKVAGLWGLALTVGLHGDVLLSGQVPASLFAKIIWTSVVLYGVASYSFACAAMNRDREENSVSATHPDSQ